MITKKYKNLYYITKILQNIYFNYELIVNFNLLYSNTN